MKYEIMATTRFRRDLKALLKRNVNVSLLQEAVDLLAEGQSLPPKNRDHGLSGEWAGHRECHIEPDWLLIYKIEKSVLILTLVRTGTHSQLFDL